MRVRYERLSIIDNKLYHGTKDTGYGIEQDTTHSFMYWITFPNQKKSTNFYTLTNACDSLKNYYIERVQKALGSPVDALE